MKQRISDVADLIAGFAFKSKDFGDSYPDKVIKITHITPPYVDMKNVSSVNMEKYNREKLKKYLAYRGDYLFAMTGATIGKIGRIEDGVAYLNQRVMMFKPHQDIDKDYLYYVLCGQDFYKYVINHIDSESAQPNISANTVGKYEFDLPAYQIQIKIGSILRNIDKKIEINRKINDNLLQQLQAVYHMMFRTQAKNDAQESCLLDICSYSQRRIAVSSLTLENYYSTENMLPGKAGAVVASSLPATVQTTRCMPGDVLISNIRPYFKKIVYCQSESGCSTDVLCFVPNTPSLSLYLYSTLYDDHFFDYMVAGSKGTKMPRGDKQQIMVYPIILPTTDQLAEFNDVAQPILAKIEIGIKENKCLSLMRDTLLPKLISGEIDVSDIAI